MSVGRGGGQTGQWVNPRRSAGQRAPAFSRRRARCGGASAIRCSGHQKGRGGYLRGAGDGLRLLVEGLELGAVGIDAGGELCGGRSSGTLGHSVLGTGGGVGRCSGFPGTRRGRQRAQTRRAGPLAAATSWPAATSSRARRSPWLEERIGIRERGVRCGGSQRWRWDARRGRGRPGADEFVDGDRRVRRGEERRGGALGLLRSREMAGRVRMEWRSWWASWGSEGGPVAERLVDGGDGSCRAREREIQGRG